MGTDVGLESVRINQECNWCTEEFSVLKRFENIVWLSSSTMHSDEIEYITQAYRTNLMSTVGENINVI